MQACTNWAPWLLSHIMSAAGLSTRVKMTGDFISSKLGIPLILRISRDEMLSHLTGDVVTRHVLHVSSLRGTIRPV